MIEYVKISTTGNIADAKKYDILELTNPMPYLDTPITSGSTLSGATYYSLGVGKLSWKFVLGVYNSDARAGYGNISNILTIINADSEPAISLKFQDWISSATTYTAYLMNRGQDSILEAVTATIDASNSFYRVNIELRQA
jgi:hypothetical protein